MAHPPHIQGSWRYSGSWLGHYCLIDQKDLGEPLRDYFDKKDKVCPVCEYPRAISISMYNLHYALHYWCLACETVYQWYVARCPECRGFIWSKGCQPGMVVCSNPKCGMEWDQDFIEEYTEAESKKDEEGELVEVFIEEDEFDGLVEVFPDEEEEGLTEVYFTEPEGE